MSPLKIEDRVVGARAQPGGDVADGAARAERLLLGDVLQVEPERGAVAEVRLEDLGQIGRGQHDVLDARRPGPRQLVREERDAGRRNHRLRRVHRERTQPGALAADQEDRFCHLLSLLPAGAGRTVCRPASVCRPFDGRGPASAGGRRRQSASRRALIGPGSGPKLARAWCRACA